jgi:hypothetical protein
VATSTSHVGGPGRKTPGEMAKLESNDVQKTLAGDKPETCTPIAPLGKPMTIDQLFGRSVQLSDIAIDVSELEKHSFALVQLSQDSSAHLGGRNQDTVSSGSSERSKIGNVGHSKAERGNFVPRNGRTWTRTKAQQSNSTNGWSAGHHPTTARQGLESPAEHEGKSWKPTKRERKNVKKEIVQTFDSGKTEASVPASCHTGSKKTKSPAASEFQNMSAELSGAKDALKEIKEEIALKAEEAMREKPMSLADIPNRKREIFQVPELDYRKGMFLVLAVFWLAVSTWFHGEIWIAVAAIQSVLGLGRLPLTTVVTACHWLLSLATCVIFLYLTSCSIARRIGVMKPVRLFKMKIVRMVPPIDGPRLLVHERTKLERKYINKVVVRFSYAWGYRPPFLDLFEPGARECEVAYEALMGIFNFDTTNAYDQDPDTTREKMSRNLKSIGAKLPQSPHDLLIPRTNGVANAYLIGEWVVNLLARPKEGVLLSLSHLAFFYGDIEALISRCRPSLPLSRARRLLSQISTIVPRSRGKLLRCALGVMWMVLFFLVLAQTTLVRTYTEQESASATEDRGPTVQRSLAWQPSLAISFAGISVLLIAITISVWRRGSKKAIMRVGEEIV